jgi:RNA polymerase sigma-70 factor (ECF subfamily)
VEDRPPVEVELVARARAGETAAFGDLVTMHEETAFRVAYLIVRDADDAADAVQEGFVKAYRALGRFRPEAPFRPWLLEIVANTARNRRRAAGRREHLRWRAERAATAVPPVSSPEAAVVGEEGRRAVLEAVNALAENDRLVIAARYFLDLSEAETAALLGVARGTVKSRLSRARDRLARILREQEGAGPR